ncbi:MAG: leucyl/phenylalanyl-tRNA--protein transferase [Woeseiaceae bacterium]|jgi:leucyl/phenylalanyl-tRNA---protein transferase|nr:leucyl/phenylalanyl-tRNA--protein transferase [Woeseiaceae bacterium]
MGSEKSYFDLAIPDNEHGIVGLGGNLEEKNLITAYKDGIFPWYNHDEDIIWWSPNPRCILHPKDIYISRRTYRVIKNSDIYISFNRAFDDVIKNCAKPRKNQEGSWIHNEMYLAYIELHKSDWCHSVEVWLNNDLIGGLYGVGIDEVFFAESMFSTISNGSKFALFSLCQILKLNNFPLIDCQVPSKHLIDHGAINISRENFIKILGNSCIKNNKFKIFPSNKIKLCEFIQSKHL